VLACKEEANPQGDEDENGKGDSWDFIPEKEIEGPGHEDGDPDEDVGAFEVHDALLL